MKLPPRDGAVLGFGTRLGLTLEGGVLAVSPESQYLCSCLNEVVKDILKACALQSTWASLQIIVDTTA